MADPLSIASAIVGILSAAGQVIKILGPYVSAAKDTPMTASTVRSEVINFRILLSALQGLLDNLDVATGVRTSLVAIDDLVLVLTDGVLIFSELEASVSSLDATGTRRPSLTLRMQWVRKEKELSSIVNRLQNFKGSVLLLLNILQCDSDLRASQTQIEFSQRAESLWANPVLSRRLATLEVAITNFRVTRPQLPDSRSSRASSVSDDQSFYSIETLRPSQSTSQTSNITEPPPSVSTPDFEADLEGSRVYQGTEGGRIGVSSRESIATSKADSTYSGVSLAQISVLSAIAVPVYSDDISNAQHYVFSEAKGSKTSKQRYLSTSSALYKSCSSNVIGSWSETRRRIFSWNQLQFEVEFVVPVIFVAPPDNKNGPVPNAQIVLIDGSERSRQDSRSDLSDWAASLYNAKGWRNVGIATDGCASWLLLLHILQGMETDSRLWQDEQYRLQPPPANGENAKSVPDDIARDYTLAVGIQGKAMKWNTLPAGISNPYAITTMSHIVEIAAMLGLYWIEFNLTNDNYRAVNTSLNLTGGEVPGLGIVFAIKQHRPLRFESSRIIPVDEVKDFCFGFVPTVYHRKYDYRRLHLPRPVPRDLSILNFSSNVALAETLASIGCNMKTVNCFAKNSTARVSHLFPSKPGLLKDFVYQFSSMSDRAIAVVFEIVGMLSQTLHIRRSAFQSLPNPTCFRWDQTDVSMIRLLDAYARQMHLLQTEPSRTTTFVRNTIQRNIGSIQRLTETENSDALPNLPLMNALHSALDDMDEILTGSSMRPQPTAVEEFGSESIQDTRQARVRNVLRIHIQEVFQRFNNMAPNGDSSPGNSAEQSLFTEIDTVASALQQDRLMEAYFRVVRKQVITDSRRKNSPRNPSGSEETISQTNISAHRADTAGKERQMALLALDSGELCAEDIWCTLVFRMICWLTLHTFHKDDVQIPKSELQGSRQPVYIV